MKYKVNNFLIANRTIYYFGSRIEKFTKGEKYEILIINESNNHVGIVGNCQSGPHWFSPSGTIKCFTEDCFDSYDPFDHAMGLL